jgi:hypothetical protein
MTKEMLKDLDNLAWNIVCNWYKDVDFDPIYEGVDFSLLLRSVLRSRVGRAVRLKNNFIKKNIITANQVEDARIKSQDKPNLFQSLMTFCKLKTNIRKHVCYIPQYARPLHSLCSELFDDKTFLCVTRDANISNRFVYPLRVRKSRQFLDFMKRLCVAIHQSFEYHGIILEDSERDLLDFRIYELGDLFIKAKYDLNIVKPDFILCYSDESLPQICYVLLAKKMGIKTISLQHGLDCELLYLDEPYSDLMLLWGKYRQDRYEKSQNIFGSEFEIIGNPEYDDFCQMVPTKNDGKYWLYVTRPHSSDKCYSPSRLETEGVVILNEILKVLKDYPNEMLIIKPHPYDYLEEYKKAISCSGLGEQVEITNKPPVKLYGDAKFVISEDSTAGLEAVIFNKHLLHVHFALSPYTIPFKEYDVGLFAADGEELRQGVEKFISKEYNTIFDESKRRQFIEDFLYRLDGESTNRAINKIRKHLNCGSS